MPLPGRQSICAMDAPGREPRGFDRLGGFVRAPLVEGVVDGGEE
jgi:hypothetical protein